MQGANAHGRQGCAMTKEVPRNFPKTGGYTVGRADITISSLIKCFNPTQRSVGSRNNAMVAQFDHIYRFVRILSRSMKSNIVRPTRISCIASSIIVPCISYHLLVEARDRSQHVTILSNVSGPVSCQKVLSFLNPQDCHIWLITDKAVEKSNSTGSRSDDNDIGDSKRFLCS